MKRPVVFAVGLCLVFLSSALAQDNERMVVAPYPSDVPWKNITNIHNAQQMWLEWIPADQTVADIKDILTEQAFYTLKDADPEAFLVKLTQRMAPACAHARVHGPTRATENGYRVAYAQLYCSGQTQMHQDVDVVMKAIGGKDALYVVQREFHRPEDPQLAAGTRVYSADQVDEVKAHMGGIVVALQFLATKVALCPPGGGTGICAAP